MRADTRSSVAFGSPQRAFVCAWAARRGFPRMKPAPAAGARARPAAQTAAELRTRPGRPLPQPAPSQRTAALTAARLAARRVVAEEATRQLVDHPVAARMRAAAARQRGLQARDRVAVREAGPAAQAHPATAARVPRVKSPNASWPTPVWTNAEARWCTSVAARANRTR